MSLDDQIVFTGAISFDPSGQRALQYSVTHSSAVSSKLHAIKILKQEQIFSRGGQNNTVCQRTTKTFFFPKSLNTEGAVSRCQSSEMTQIKVASW